MPAQDETRDRILEVTRRLVQSKGFSGFSYADVAAEVGIRKASVHHHFPTKGDLGEALMVRYRRDFGEILARIRASKGDARSRLRAYAVLFADLLRDDYRLCMCGMLAADFDVLPPSVRGEVRGFFDDNEEWLADVLASGRKQQELSFVGSPREQARVLLSALEGAMLVARSHGDVSLFEGVAQRVFHAVTAPPRRAVRAPVSLRRASRRVA